MTKIKHVATTPEQEVIDNRVIEEAKNSQLWDNKVEVTPALEPTSIRLDSRTILKAKVLSKIIGTKGYRAWMRKVIEDKTDEEYKLLSSFIRAFSRNIMEEIKDIKHLDLHGKKGDISLGAALKLCTERILH